MVIKPPKLKRGDKVAVIPLSRHTLEFADEIESGCAVLEKEMGLRVVRSRLIGKKVGDASGTADERAADLNRLVADPEIKAVFAALGGDRARDLLPLIDYQVLSGHPKIIFGYSDITHILLAVHKKCGLVTFHGPSVKDFGHLTEAARRQIKDVLFGLSAPVTYPPEIDIISPGRARGRLCGGNLMVINNLSGTDFAPDFGQKILFWEDIDDGTPAIEKQVERLKESGLLKKISGMIIGRVIETQPGSKSGNKILADLCADLRVPVIRVDYFGHRTDNFFTFPVGVAVDLNTEKHQFSLSEKAVD